ncbi:MAG: hypothetical protein EZS28_032614 [Streblomastix strix]|uniref:Uncharacterized protein n=1 Tax=Streblomastix strix TaxID=222440 RepID=A0A5J4UN01_9EUKA|nr:MAG: hypothetical protein EZS28_032614 [Streblomastix strix]
MVNNLRILPAPNFDRYLVDKSPQTIFVAAKNLKIVQVFESLIIDWSRNVKPVVELEYWMEKMGPGDAVAHRVT